MKQIEDKIKIIELLEQVVADKDKQIAWLSQSCDALADEVRRLEAQVGMLKAQNDQWMASSEARHAKSSEKTKNPTTPHKEMVEYLKKHKPKKWYNGLSFLCQRFWLFKTLTFLVTY